MKKEKFKQRISEFLKSRPFSDWNSLQALVDENKSNISFLKKEIKKREIGRKHNVLYRTDIPFGGKPYDYPVSVPKGIWKTAFSEEYNNQIRNLKEQIAEIEKENRNLNLRISHAIFFHQYRLKKAKEGLDKLVKIL
jgi:hypothetical protein